MDLTTESQSAGPRFKSGPRLHPSFRQASSCGVLIGAGVAVCCKVVVSCVFSEFRSEQIHGVNSRLRHGFDVNVHGEPNVAVSQDCLDCFVVDAQGMKIRRESAAKGVAFLVEWVEEAGASAGLRICADAVRNFRQGREQ